MGMFVSISSACRQTPWPSTASASSPVWMGGAYRSSAPPCCSSWTLVLVGRRNRGRSLAATRSLGQQMQKVSGQSESFRFQNIFVVYNEMSFYYCMAGIRLHFILHRCERCMIFIASVCMLHFWNIPFIYVFSFAFFLNSANVDSVPRWEHSHLHYYWTTAWHKCYPVISPSL